MKLDDGRINHKKFFLIIALCLIAALPSGAAAEDLRDLREGITGDISGESKWGFFPRFKMNPDTGTGTGVKLKGANVFGTPLYFDIGNIFTTTRYQIYELTISVPRMGGGAGYWYAAAFSEFNLVPDMRFFGVGNRTNNFMDDETDGRVGNESALEYKSIDSRLIAGRCVRGRYFIALEPLYRQVWIGKGDNDNLPHAEKVYKNLAGTSGGKSPGIRLSAIMATRSDQWRPESGVRLELNAENRGRFFGSDYEYSKLSVDARSYRNLFGGYNVLAFRVRFDTVIGSLEDTPWWDLPSVGGRDSVRGYWEGRFRGKRSAIANAEYRFHLFDISPELFGREFKYVFDGNIFFDAGQVYMPGEDIHPFSSDGEKTGWGFGIRATTPPNLMARLDIGFSGEMKFATYFNFGTVF